MLLTLLSLTMSLPMSYAADVAGHATISGRVDVPMYAGLDDMDPFFYVEVAVGEKKGLFVIATGHDEVRLTAKGAGFFGVEFKKDKPAKLGELTIGGVTLTDVVAVERGPSVGDPPLKAMPLLGEIGLQGFPELAFAVLPSAGVLRLAPAAEGAALVSEVGGALDLSCVEAEKRKVGTEKIEFAAACTADIAVSGQKVPAILATERAISSLMREVSIPPMFWTKDKTIPQLTLPAAPTRYMGDVAIEWRSVTAGAVTSDLSLLRPGVGASALYAVPAKLGQSFLRGVDLAFDLANGKVGMRQAAAVKLGDWYATAEALARKPLDPAPAAEGAPAPTAEEQKEARLGALPGVAGWYDNAGRFDQSAPLWQELTVGKPEDCKNWLNYGNALVRTGKGGEAVTAAKKAAELYAAWAALPLEERNDTAEKYGKAKDKAAWTGNIPQDHACHTAWSTVAAGMVLSGDYAGAAALLPAHRDLDEALALMAGNALLLQGKKEEAQAAYLQSFAIDRSVTAEGRVGMVLTARTLEQALNQFSAAKGWSLVSDPGTLRAYLGAVTSLGGADAARKEAARLLALDPANPMLLTANARLASGGIDNALLQRAGARFDELLRLYPGSAMLQAAYADYLLAKGDSAAARAAAAKATTLSPRLASAWWLLAEIDAAAGDTAKAAEARRRASALAVENPVYVGLLKG